MPFGFLRTCRSTVWLGIMYNGSCCRTPTRPTCRKRRISVGFPTRRLARLAVPCSNRLLECSYCECLDDSLGRLCFHHHFFAEHHPFCSFCCWFPPSLDPGKARDGENACLLHLSGTNLCQAIQKLTTTLFFSSDLVARASARAPLLMVLAA